MNPIGIMQGRLSPPPAGRIQTFPVSTWEQEFATAAAAGFDCLEWLVSERDLDANPILTDEGARAIRRHTARTGIAVRSVCADYFVTSPLARAADRFEARLQVLESVIERAAALDIAVVVVPFLESGAVESPDEWRQILSASDAVWLTAANAGIRVALETDLDGAALAAVLDATRRPCLGACYDTGNAAARGADIRRDLEALGPRLIEVHIKDRLREGPSQPLGRGSVDFDVVADTLATLGFRGPLILETPAGSDPATSGAANLAYLRARLQRLHPH